MTLYPTEGKPVIHGFISRVEAEKRLTAGREGGLPREAGTFLLRFSESQPGSLVISFIHEASSPEVDDHTTSADWSNRRPSLSDRSKKLEVQHCLVIVGENNFSIKFTEGEAQSYLDLTGLIHDCLRLKFLEPDIAKVRLSQKMTARGAADFAWFVQAYAFPDREARTVPRNNASGPNFDDDIYDAKEGRNESQRVK